MSSDIVISFKAAPHLNLKLRNRHQSHSSSCWLRSCVSFLESKQGLAASGVRKKAKNVLCLHLCSLMIVVARPLFCYHFIFIELCSC